jgi:hypothetical protein
MPRDHAILRRQFVQGLAAATVAPSFIPTIAAAARSGRIETCEQDDDDHLSLSTIPRNVYKIPDPDRMPTDSWFFYVLVHDRQDRQWTPLSVDLTLMAGGGVVCTSHLGADHLRILARKRFQRSPTDAPLRTIAQVTSIVLLFREARPLNVDRVECTLALEGPDGVRCERRLDVAVRTYTPVTQLIFPFRGAGIVTQGAFNNGGHASWSEMFAVDAMGMDMPTYAFFRGGEGGLESFAGWDREIIAPASGRVIYARNDVPDQPEPYVIDESTYAGLPDPGFARGGNQVIIDHGHDEFSAINHLRQGSVTVAIGDEVRQGQTIGRLGMSGNTDAPHLHYHLQAGPVEFDCDGLPITFVNVTQSLTRGTIFEPA